MDNKSLDEQLWKIKDSVRRAKAYPDKTGTFRRETFRQLIDLTHSRHSSLKILAAGNIRYFIRYFPDLEEAAINAVYDLCEDQDSEVRKVGYSAVTQVSRERIKWVKRNADVLVQLLQSDEPDEVIMVKHALVEHLEMDPNVTLGVLCDQIIPPEEPMSEEDLFVRDRLRSLVLSFINREAKQAIVEHRSRQPDGDVQEMLIQALMAVIPKLSNADVEVIVKDVLASLPSFKTANSSHGTELVKLMLDQAKSSFRNDFRPENPASFETTRLYLNLAKHLVLNENLTSPNELLQFFCASMIGKMTLQKFSADDRVSVICDTAEILTACYEDVRCRNSKDFLFSQRQIVDACPILLEGLSDPAMSQVKSWKACRAFLQACLRRKKDHQWSVPAHLLNLLNRIQVLPEPTREINDYRDVQALIRSLAQPSQKPVTQQPAIDVSSGLTRKVEDSRGNGELSNLSQATTVSPKGDGVSAEPVLTVPGVHSAASKRPTPSEDGSRAQKKMKQGDTDLHAPSLLSRMGNTVTDRSHAYESGKDSSASFQGSDMSAGGYSIRGAAKAERRSETSSGTTWSLLDRIKDLSTRDDETVRKKRRRGGGGGGRARS